MLKSQFLIHNIYAMRGYLTSKADVYSFGVVALEIVSGKSNTSYRSNGDSVYLLDWANSLLERGALTEMVDPTLGSQYSAKEATIMLHVALLCTNASPSLRPAMSEVVGILEGTIEARDFPLDLSLSSGTSKSRGGDLKKQFWEDTCGSDPTTVNGLTSVPSSFVESDVSGLSMDAGSLKDGSLPYMYV